MSVQTRCTIAGSNFETTLFTLINSFVEKSSSIMNIELALVT